MRKTRSGLKKLLIYAAVAALAGRASAVLWHGDVDDLWSNGNNWTDDGYTGANVGVPTAATDVGILNPLLPPVRIDAPGAVANTLSLGVFSWPGNLTVDAAGTLAVTTHILLGREPGIVTSLTNDGQLTTGLLYVREVGTFVNNGTLTVTSNIILGDSATSVSIISNTGDMTVNGWLHLSVNSPTPSVFNMNGGAFNVGHIEMNSTGSARLNLHGGTITAGTIGLNGTGAYTIDIRGDGELIVNGDQTGGLNFMIGAGFITASNGGVLAAEFDGVKTSLRVEEPRYDLAAMLRPVWEGPRIENETVLPTSYDAALAEANLIFPASTIISVGDYGLGQTYEEGLDYVVEGRTIRLTEGSSIPFFNYSDLYHNNPDAEPGTLPTVDGGYLTYSETSLFTDRQLTVSYEHEGSWTGAVPQSAELLLPSTFATLKAGASLNLIVFGDSISSGGNSSGGAGIAPWLPRWSDLVVSELGRYYGSDIEHSNPSVGGWTSGSGVANVEAMVADETPDLVIIGFGMNDGHGISAAQFIANLEAMMASVRAQNPAAEFILLMSFQPNSKWLSLDLMEQYLVEMKKLEGPGVAVADVWSVHDYLLQNKTYWDMTGNHVNHPNDFISRIYAQVLLARLGLNADPVQTFTLPTVFSDDMVLQRQAPIPVYGTSDVDSAVTVSLVDGTDTVIASTNGVVVGGDWSVQLPAMEAGGPYKLVVSGGAGVAVEFSNVMIGEVYILAGQSNMDWLLAQMTNSTEILAEVTNFNMRIITPAQTSSTTPQENYASPDRNGDDATWKELDASSGYWMSALGYFFGKEMTTELGVTVGIVNTSRGGTFIHQWVPLDAIEASPLIDPTNSPSILYALGQDSEEFAIERWYNALVVPVQGYGVKAILWYQGEGNIWWQDEYKNFLSLLMQTWRERWDIGSIPFLVFQLPGYGALASTPAVEQWGKFREAQEWVVENNDDAYLVVNVPGGERNQIHPQDKPGVGWRASRVALQNLHGQSVVGSSPSLVSAARNGSSIVCTFDHGGASLAVKEVTVDGLQISGDSLSGFAVAGSNGVWTNATAVLLGSSNVVVSSLSVSNPVHVMYGMENFPLCNLFNTAEMPCAPFRFETTHALAGYVAWGVGWGVDIGGATDDYDGDGIDNLMEYALGGDPRAVDSASVRPVFQALENYFYHIHNERTDDSNLTYTVETNTNLVSNGWKTNGVEFVDEASFSNVWKTVTNRTDIGATEFIRLRVENGI